MAKLPTYKQTNLLVEKTPKVQFNNAVYVNAANTMNRAIDNMQKMIDPIMEQNAKDAALEFSIDNPLTLDQIQNAKNTGADPIESYKRGGLVFNDTLDELYANQAANQVKLADQDNREFILSQVNTGQLKDIDVIKEKLSSEVKGNSRVLYDMSPKVAQAYMQTSAVNAHTYFRAATKSLTAQAELEQKLVSNKTTDSAIVKWETALDTITDMTELMDMKEMLINEATNQYRLTGKPFELQKALRKQLNTVEIQKMAQVAAAEHYTDLGLPVDQIMENLITTETLGRHTNYYQQLDPAEQKQFRTAIKANLTNLSIGDKSNKEGQSKKFNGIAKRLANLETVSEKDFAALPVINDINDKNFGKTEELLTMQGDSLQALNLSAKDFAEYIKEETKDYNFMKGLTQEESDRFNWLKGMQKTMTERDTKAPVEAMLAYQPFADRTEIVIDPAKFGDMDYVKNLQQEIQQRQVDMKIYADQRSITTRDIFTDNEIAGFVQTWTEGSNGEKIALSTFLVTEFEDNASIIFEKIQEKDQVFSQVGYLSLNGIRNAADPLYMQKLNNHILNGEQINTRGELKYALGKDKEATTADVLGNAFNNAPNLKNQIIKTADYIYFSMNQTTPNEYNSDMYAQALQMASGQIQKHTLIPDPLNVVDGVEQMQLGEQEVYGGLVQYRQQTLAIPTVIKQDSFAALIEDATLEDFKMALSDAEGNLYNFAPTDEAPQFTLDQYQEAYLEFVNDSTASLSQGPQNFFASLAEGLKSNVKGFDDDLYYPFENNGTPLYLNFVVLHDIMNKRYPGKY